MTLISEWNKVDMTDEQKGVYETIKTTNEVVPFLEFKEIEGNSYEYERESVNPTATTVDDEGELVDSSIEFAEKSASLKTIYVQNYLNLKKKQIAKKQDPLAILKVKMSKSWGREMQRLVIQGDSTATATEFDGVDKILRDETRIMAMDDGAIDGPGSAETELTITRLREMIDAIEGGGPQLLMMNKTMRRKITNLAYAAGGGIQLPTVEAFGRRMPGFDDIPIIINDFIPNDQQYGDAGNWGSSTATSIYALNFGEERGGFTLFHNGGFLAVEFQDLGKRKNRNEEVWRLIGYPGSGLYEPLTCIGLSGIDSAA